MKDILKITIGVTLGICISELYIIPKVKKKKLKAVLSKPFNFLFKNKEK